MLIIIYECSGSAYGLYSTPSDRDLARAAVRYEYFILEITHDGPFSLKVRCPEDASDVTRPRAGSECSQSARHAVDR